MEKRTAKADARKSSIRATVGHVFAQLKHRMMLTIRSVGIKRAEPCIRHDKRPFGSLFAL